MNAEAQATKQSMTTFGLHAIVVVGKVGCSMSLAIKTFVLLMALLLMASAQTEGIRTWQRLLMGTNLLCILWLCLR